MEQTQRELIIPNTSFSVRVTFAHLGAGDFLTVTRDGTGFKLKILYFSGINEPIRNIAIYK